MYAAATLHTLFDIASFSSAFTLFPMLGPRERDGVGFTHLGIYPLCLLQEESIPNWVRTKQDLSRAEILYNIWGISRKHTFKHTVWSIPLLGWLSDHREKREHCVWKTGLWFIFKYFERSSLGSWGYISFCHPTLPVTLPGTCQEFVVCQRSSGCELGAFVLQTLWTLSKVYVWLEGSNGEPARNAPEQKLLRESSVYHCCPLNWTVLHVLRLIKELFPWQNPTETSCLLWKHYFFCDKKRTTGFIISKETGAEGEALWVSTV